jgi:uncharacterized protein with FMN-binding domain
MGLIVIVLRTSVGTVGAVAYNNRPLSQSTVSATALPVGSATTSSSGTQTSSTSSSTTTATTNYKDGTYTATGSFYTPNGSEQIGVTVTLASNKITTVSIDSSSITSGTSYEYTSLFADGINQAVDGQNINDVQVGRISGASLTPIGFNNALQTIKNDAQA